MSAITDAPQSILMGDVSDDTLTENPELLRKLFLSAFNDRSRGNWNASGALSRIRSYGKGFLPPHMLLRISESRPVIMVREDASYQLSDADVESIIDLICMLAKADQPTVQIGRSLYSTEEIGHTFNISMLVDDSMSTTLNRVIMDPWLDQVAVGSTTGTLAESLALMQATTLSDFGR